MSAPAKRLYISKLPDFLKKSDLESKFAHYGKVVSVEIIHRKNGVQENQAPFAYINLETSSEELFRCIRDFANKKWKGEFVDVQMAKESFLSRLQREREEKSKKQGGDEKWKAEPAGEGWNVNGDGRGRGKKLYFDEGLNEEVKKESNKRKKIYFGEEDGDVKEEIIENTSLLNGNKSVESSANIVKKDPKHIEADKKRKSSNIEMRNQFRQQKLLIRSALSNLDGKATNKKIIFDENLSETQVVTNQKKNKPLFDDDSESDEEINVVLSKPQFEGKEGHKLFQLQSRFQNDKRFVMNEKFLEDEHVVKENAIEVAKDEKETQLSILEQVLGKKVANEAVKQKQPKAMLRFNPDDPQHKGYELQHQEEEKPSTKKKKRKEAPQPTDETKPEVSKSKFYKVADDLKNVFQTENKSFSLLAARKVDEIETQEENHQLATYEIPKKTNIDFNEAFNNLTSDEEEIEEAISPPQQQQEEETSKNKSAAADRVRFWSEPFFFAEDDFRFQEGMDFIKRIGCQESGDFLELRRNVKEVVRAKVKNVNKKKRMFKKKLGGVKKRMKMKRALKR